MHAKNIGDIGPQVDLVIRSLCIYEFAYFTNVNLE